jgi:tetratricopeptide (TPR) repeat protein
LIFSPWKDLSENEVPRFWRIYRVRKVASAVLREMKLMLQLLLTFVVVVCAASSVFANDEQDCFQGNDAQLRIKGCSDLIQRAPNDATAYHNRAFAYGLTGDVDNAIADYSKVIALTPSDASAYVNRGRAYASKGDYVHAAEDETKARELIAKATAQPLDVAAKSPRMPKRSVAATKPAPVSRKGKSAPASNNTGQDGAGGFWSWLWGNGADQASGKNAKR